MTRELSFSITSPSVKKKIGRWRQKTSSAGLEVWDVVGWGREEKGGEKRWGKEEGLKRFGHHDTVSTYERKGFKQSPHERCASVTLQRLQTPTTETRRCLNRGNHLKGTKKMKMSYFPFSLGAIWDGEKSLCCYCMKISKRPEFMLL